MAHEVGSFIDHEAATLHLDGVTSVEVGVKVGTVATALMKVPLKVSVFVKNDLQKQWLNTQKESFHFLQGFGGVVEQRQKN